MYIDTCIHIIYHIVCIFIWNFFLHCHISLVVHDMVHFITSCVALSYSCIHLYLYIYIWHYYYSGWFSILREISIYLYRTMLYCTGVFRILSCINHCLVHIVCSVLSICIGFMMFVSHFASCIVALHAVSVVLVDACLLYHTIVCSERRYCVIQGPP